MEIEGAIEEGKLGRKLKVAWRREVEREIEQGNCKGGSMEGNKEQQMKVSRY